MSSVTFGSSSSIQVNAKFALHTLLSDAENFPVNFSEITKLVLQNTLSIPELYEVGNLISITFDGKLDGMSLKQRLFFSAVYLDKPAELLLLINDGSIEIEATDPDGLNALIYASENGLMPIIEVLLSHGANVDSTTKGDETALHYAAARGHSDVVTYLLQPPHCKNKEALLEAKTNRGVRALHVAASKGHFFAFKALLEAGADMFARVDNPEGYNVLHILVRDGRVDFIQELFHDKECPTFVDFHSQMVASQLARLQRPTPKGGGSVRTQTHEQASLAQQDSPHVEKIKRLIATPALNGAHSLNMAATAGHPLVCRLLLKHGANPRIKIEDGRHYTPLLLASYYNFSAVAQELIQHTLTTNPEGMADLLSDAESNGETASSLVCLRNATAVLPLLLKAGATVKMVDFWEAASVGNVGIVTALLQIGYDINYQFDGLSILQVASRERRIPVLSALIQFQRDRNPSQLVQFLDQTGPKGSALELAVANNHFEVVTLLVDAGASTPIDVVHQSIDLGFTAISIYFLQKIPKGSNTLNFKKYTLLLTACQSEENNGEILQFLLNEDGLSREEIEVVDEFGQRPLHYSAVKKDAREVQLLLSAGADATACVMDQQRVKFNALLLSIDRDCPNVLKELLSNVKEKSPQKIQAFLDQKGANGFAPLSFATTLNQFESVRTLLSFGATVDEETLKQAICGGMEEMVLMFSEHLRTISLDEKLEFIFKAQQVLSYAIAESVNLMKITDDGMQKINKDQELVLHFFRRNSGDAEKMCGKMERISKLVVGDKHEQSFYDSVRAGLKNQVNEKNNSSVEMKIYD